jgi:hypothetical protein
MTVAIDVELARKVLGLIDQGLTSGLGKPEPGEMCIEAAVAYAMGEGHTDQPSCVAPVLRALKIRLNDARWSSNQARAAGMRRLGIAQLGSAGALDEREFAKRVATLAIRKCVPEALRAAAALCKGEHKEKLLQHADLCERDATYENAIKARDAAKAAANAAANYAAAYAAANYAAAKAADYAAAYPAAKAAEYAANAADAANYAANAADAANYAAAKAAKAAKLDASLSSFAEAVVQILIDMKAPGCAFLHITERTL